MYKDWPKINRIQDLHLLWAIALIDLKSQEGRRLIIQLPEYFTSEERFGPVALSVLRLIAEKNATAQSSPGEGSNHLVCYEAIPEWMPTLYFAQGTALTQHASGGAELVPDELKSATTVGTTHTWHGKSVVLVDHLKDSGGQWWFVPAECIVTNR